ncbi:hypothetical protein [Anaerotignum sp.]
MKKITGLLLAIIMCISMCACGNDSEKYIGVWESAHMRFTIDEGGIGRYEMPNSGMGYFDFTWEVKDEVIVITIDSAVSKYTASFELYENDEVGEYLKILHNGLPSYNPNETEYFKQLN